MRLLLLLLLSCYLFALSPIDIAHTQKLSILEACDIKNNQKFEPLKKEHLNLGVLQNSITIECLFKNSSHKKIEKILYFSSPLLEKIELKDANSTTKKGVFSTNKQTTITHFFNITLKPQSQKLIELTIETRYTPLDFSIFLEDSKAFFDQDRNAQSLSIFLLGIITALMLYAFIIGIYSKEKSYIFYGIYLLALIFHQSTYIGITQIYMPKAFVLFDAKITIIKIALLIITSALFAMSFLETKEYKAIHKTYQAIILLALLEALLLTPKSPISLYAIILTGAFFILFNLLAGVYIYKSGKKEARLFVLGFGVVFIAYVLIIIDALGIASVMQNNKNLLTVTTTIEALILSLAFADKFAILQKEKEKADKKLLIEAKNRENIITKQVELKTKELKNALKEKEILMQEIHHRVKNNLQIILSMVRLQNDSIEDSNTKESLVKLENRINAIAQSYSSLLSSNSLQIIDMQSYVKNILDDLETIFGASKDIKIIQDISLQLPFKQAVYIGLIINELVTNAFKHAFIKEGVITIKLYNDKEKNILEVFDNGRGFDSEKTKHSLGLRLIYAIVKNQLDGEIILDTKNKTHCTIRF